MINLKTVSNVLQGYSYSTFLTFYKRIACSAFAVVLLLLWEYRKVIKFIEKCIIRSVPVGLLRFLRSSLTVGLNGLPHDGLAAEANFPADHRWFAIAV